MLNQYTGERDNVMRAINLRTLLEAFYIDSRSDTIASDIKKRIMLNCGKTGKVKKHIGDKTIKLYDICSSAAHNGRLTEDETQRLRSYEEEIVDIIFNNINNLLEGVELVKLQK